MRRQEIIINGESLMVLSSNLEDGGIYPSDCYLEADVNGFHFKNDVKIQENADSLRVVEIDARFLEIDKESARPMRELAFNPSDTFAVAKLTDLEEELVVLRAERLTLI